MKKCIKFISNFTLLSVVLISMSCEDEDKEVFDIHTDVDNQAPFVNISYDPPVVAITSVGESSFTGTLEAPNNNVSSWNVGISLVSGANVGDTIPLTTVNSFPSDVSFTFEQLATTLGLSGTQELIGGDIIRFVATSVGSNGVEIDASDLTGNARNSPGLRQAYSFTSQVECAPFTDNISGDWVVDMQDSFGDGWNGAALNFSVDGASPERALVTDGGAATQTITVPSSASEVLVFFSNGTFDEEITFTVTTPSGEVLGPFGPSPGRCIN